MTELAAVCELTADGLQNAKEYLKSKREQRWAGGLSELLSDPRYAEPLEQEAYVESRAFADRREAGQYLAQQLESVAAAGGIENSHMWSWLGMFYLEAITTHDSDSTRRVREYPETAHLIDSIGRDSRDRSHHRLKIAYDVWTRYGDDAWLLLNDPVSSMSQFTLRMVQAPEIFRARGVVPLAHMLYADRATGRLRKSAGGMDNATAPPGSVPRLLQVLNHLSLTYDVYGMTANDLLRLLPQEFDRFRDLALAP